MSYSKYKVIDCDDLTDYTFCARINSDNYIDIVNVSNEQLTAKFNSKFNREIICNQFNGSFSIIFIEFFGDLFAYLYNDAKGIMVYLNSFTRDIRIDIKSVELNSLIKYFKLSKLNLIIDYNSQEFIIVSSYLSALGFSNDTYNGISCLSLNT